jgi:hypothetical protein
MGFAIFVINIGIHNHPPKKFAKYDKEEVMILMEAPSTKQYVHGTKVIILEKHIV